MTGMKQVAREQQHIDLALLGNLQDFLERVKGVIAADRVALEIPNVIIGRDLFFFSNNNKGNERTGACRAMWRSWTKRPHIHRC